MGENLLNDRGNRGSLATIFALWAVLVLLLFLAPPGRVLSWDALGYYLYLPAFFIHNDPLLLHQGWLHHALETYGGLNGGGFYQAHQVANGNWVMKYTMGMAALWAPFVAIAHFLAPLLGYPADGFSRPYQIAVVVAEMTYVLLGLLWLRAVLLHWWNDRVVSITLILVVLGTNYLHQALFANSMPHIFLFTLQAGVLYASMRWHDERKRRHALLLTACIGLAALARPTEIVLVLIPLLWGRNGGIRGIPRFLGDRVHHDRRMLLGMGLGLCLIGSMQLAYWKYATGHFLHMSYTGTGEGFEFLHPYTLQALFGFRKGWFIYTPMMLLAVLRAFRLKKEAMEARISVIAFIVVNVYIVTSWSNWWYAESFGNRGLMQSIAVMSVPLAALVGTAVKGVGPRRWSIVAAMSAFTLLNLFQTWQSYAGLIPGSRMTFSYYTAVFGRTHRVPDGEARMLVDRSGPLPKGIHEDGRHHWVRSMWIAGDQAVTDAGPQPLRPPLANWIFDGGESYSPALRVPFDSITRENNLWVHVTATFDHIGRDADGSLVVQMAHRGMLYGYERFDIGDRTAHGQAIARLDTVYLTPELRGKGDTLSIYFWHRFGPITLDAIEVSCYEPVVPSPF